MDERARAERVGRRWRGLRSVALALALARICGGEGRQHDNEQRRRPTTHNNQTEYGGGRRKTETVIVFFI
jgi:hypothetical protein